MNRPLLAWCSLAVALGVSAAPPAFAAEKQKIKEK